MIGFVFDYVVIDRYNLFYLDRVEKINCLYCEYFNGVIGYVREIAARTEQFWCPIKYSRGLKDTHSRYVDGNLLTISGIRQMKSEVSKEDYYLCESAFGRIERKFTLPEGIDRDKITAELNDGQLVIELQKEEKSKAKSIEIK